MNEKQQLEKVLWAISNDLRGNMDATKFKDYILGIIFFRFLSYNMVAEIRKFDQVTELEELYNLYPSEIKENCLATLGYFINPNNLFDNFVDEYKDGKNILEDLSKVLKDIETSTYGQESQGDFEGLFSDLNLTSQDLGIDATEKNDAIGQILVRLSEVDFQFTNSKIDVLGDAYEYMIGQFASDAGKKAGEFYTPQSVAKLLTKIIATDKKNIKSVYDPTCGSGSLLLRVAREYDIKAVNIYGEEKNTSTYNLARMNMLIHNVKYDRFKINNTNTLENPTMLNQQFDAVIANPPFSANWEANSKFLDDNRFKEYGKLAPKSKADLAFVLHMLNQVNEEGTVATLLPHGPLFRGSAEKTIREKLLKDNHIDAVIGLPQSIFTATGIPTIILILKKCKKDKDILFIDASKEFTKVKTQNILEEKHLEKIIKVYQDRSVVEKFSHLATIDEVVENDYNLNIPRYVDTFVEEEKVDLTEVSNLLDENTKKLKEKQKEIQDFLNDTVNN